LGERQNFDISPAFSVYNNRTPSYRAIVHALLNALTSVNYPKLTGENPDFIGISKRGYPKLRVWRYEVGG
jgi:hypothetical protein